MPYVASIDGKTVYSFNFSEEEFEQLKGKGLLCPGCGAKMFTKRSNLATPFFAHSSDKVRCFTSNMSADHLMAQDIIKGTIDSQKNWTGHIEYSQSNWRGDVVAIHKSTSERISFEVQFSPMTVAKAEERSARHIKSGIEQVIWLYGGDINLPKHMSGAYLLRDSESLLPETFRVVYATLPTHGSSEPDAFSNSTTTLSEFAISILTQKLVPKYYKQIGTTTDSARGVVSVNRCLFITQNQLEAPEDGTIIYDGVLNDSKALTSRRTSKKKEKAKYSVGLLEKKMSIWLSDKEKLLNCFSQEVQSKYISQTYRDDTAGGIQVRGANGQSYILEPNLLHAYKTYARDQLSNELNIIIFMHRSTKDEFIQNFGRKKLVYSYDEFLRSEEFRKATSLQPINPRTEQLGFFSAI